MYKELLSHIFVWFYSIFAYIFKQNFNHMEMLQV